ncbi:hypothetical protein ACS0TY_005705 [Phlomoides rotata]
MPGTNWRVANELVQMHGGEAVAAAGDWRNRLPSGSRHKITYKIMETLKRHHPLAGLEGFLDLKRTALLFEENIFIEATSPTDYLRKISVRMLDFEMRSQNQYSLHSYGASNSLFSSGEFHAILNNAIQSTAADAGMEGRDWRIGLHPDARQRIVNKIVETLMRHLPFSGEEGLQEAKTIAVRFEEYIYGVAMDQCDYLRKISLKMLVVERKYPNPMANCVLSNAPSNVTPIRGYAPVFLYRPTYM